MQLASVRVRDTANPSPPVAYSNTQPLSLSPLGDANAVMVRSLLVRASYGGLQGDVLMLHRFALLWGVRLGVTGWRELSAAAARCVAWCVESTEWLTDREQCDWMQQINSVYAAPAPASCSLNSVGPLSNGDCPRSAVDFHVSRVIGVILEDGGLCSRAGVQGHAPDAEDTLRSAMCVCQCCCVCVPSERVSAGGTTAHVSITRN